MTLKPEIAVKKKQKYLLLGDHELARNVILVFSSIKGQKRNKNVVSKNL